MFIRIGNKVIYWDRNTHTVGIAKSLGMYNFTEIYDDEHPDYERTFSTTEEAEREYNRLRNEVMCSV